MGPKYFMGHTYGTKFFNYSIICYLPETKI